MSETITVFDIEVLNNDPASMCAIGIVVLEGRKVKETYYSLIRPRNLAFDRYRYEVHHIRPNKLTREHSFKTIWSEIHHYFDNAIVVSHDVQNDMAHLRAALTQAKLPYPELRMSCTNVLAHLFEPDLGHYGMGDLCAFYGVTLDNAHNALADAKACAGVLVKMMERYGYDSLDAIHQDKHLAYGIMKDNHYHNIIAPDMVSVETGHWQAPLYQRAFAFAGTMNTDKEAIDAKIRDAHAFMSRNVNSHTDYLVIGKIDYRNVRYNHDNRKVKKALELKKDGQDLHIIHEDEFLHMIKAAKHHK